MKSLSTILLLSLALFITSCGSDDSCKADNWVGSWVGQLDCNDDDLDEMITLTVSKIDENTLQFNDGSDTFEIPLTGCRVTSSEVEETILGEVSIDIEASLNGDNMVWDINASIVGLSIDCSATLSRN